jgi:autotransporter-associated beta strand protein
LISYASKTSQTFAAVNGLPSGDTLSYTASGLYLVAQVVTGPATWTALSGSWTSASNWSTGVVPSGSGVTAIVGSGTSSLRTITLDSPQTLGQLTFANSTNPATGYSLAPGVAGTLTMMSSSTSSAAQIYVTSGEHAISAPLKLAGSLDISPSPGASLLIGGNISQSVAGSSLTLDNAGTLVLSGSDSYTGGTLVTAGTLDVTAANGLPNGGALTIGAGAGSLFASPAAEGVVLGGVQVATAGYPLGGNSVAAGYPLGAAVPEPGMLALLLAGLATAAIGRAGRRRPLLAKRGKLTTT